MMMMFLRSELMYHVWLAHAVLTSSVNRVLVHKLVYHSRISKWFEVFCASLAVLRLVTAVYGMAVENVTLHSYHVHVVCPIREACSCDTRMALVQIQIFSEDCLITCRSWYIFEVISVEKGRNVMMCTCMCASFIGGNNLLNDFVPMIFSINWASSVKNFFPWKLWISASLVSFLKIF